jgi:hypothetical protein
MGLTIATKCLSEHMTALKDLCYQLVTVSLRLIAEVLGLGLLRLSFTEPKCFEVLGPIMYGLCTGLSCSTVKENALFAFIWTGSAALIAPDSALVGFRPSCKQAESGALSNRPAPPGAQRSVIAANPNVTLQRRRRPDAAPPVRALSRARDSGRARRPAPERGRASGAWRCAGFRDVTAPA